jgi:hypothetical protein
VLLYRFSDFLFFPVFRNPGSRQVVIEGIAPDGPAAASGEEIYEENQKTFACASTK